jgi:hypothetical protein
VSTVSRQTAPPGRVVGDAFEVFRQQGGEAGGFRGKNGRSGLWLEELGGLWGRRVMLGLRPELG